MADDLWARFDEAAKINGTIRTDLIRQWIKDYVAAQDQSGIDIPEKL